MLTPTPSPVPSPLVVEIADSGGSQWSELWTDLGPLVTLVLGAFLAFLANWLIEKSKAKQAHATKWHEEVRRLCGSAVAAARAVHQESVDQAAFVLVPDPDQQPEADGLSAQSRARAWLAHDKLLELQSDLNLIAPGTINTALVGLVDATYLVAVSNPAQAEESREKLRPEITTFIEAVRKYLGIPSGTGEVAS